MGREVIASEEKSESLAHQSFKEALFGWSWVLKDSGKSLPLIEERRHHLFILAIYSYIFIHFHLAFHHIIFQILSHVDLSQDFVNSNNFLSLQGLRKLREAAKLKYNAAHLE